MKYRGKILLISLGFLPLFCTSQNLVPNPGFENHSACLVPPSNQSLLYCDNWFNLYDPNLVTCDWFSTCFPIGSDYEVPNNVFGSSFPHSGDAYLGFAPYSQYTNKGESFGVRLTQPLIKDSAYCFSLWFKNSRMSNWEYTNYEFDLAFVADTAGIAFASQVNNYLTLSNLTETSDWNNFSDYYIAQGGEEFLLFGVYTPNPNYHVNEPIPPGEFRYMYYYVDDFSVIPCNKDSLLAVILELPNVFTPNGDNVNDTFDIDSHNIESMDVQILSRWGNTVARYDGLTSGWNGIDQNGDPVSDGVYFVHVTAETAFGEMLNKQGFVQLYRHGE